MKFDMDDDARVVLDARAPGKPDDSGKIYGTLTQWLSWCIWREHNEMQPSMLGNRIGGWNTGPVPRRLSAFIENQEKFVGDL
jgi:hypothetical protein